MLGGASYWSGSRLLASPLMPIFNRISSNFSVYLNSSICLHRPSRQYVEVPYRLQYLVSLGRERVTGIWASHRSNTLPFKTCSNQWVSNVQTILQDPGLHGYNGNEQSLTSFLCEMSVTWRCRLHAFDGPHRIREDRTSSIYGCTIHGLEDY